MVETLHVFSYMFPPNMGVIVFCTSPDSMYPGNLADAMVERGRLSARSADSSIGSGEGFVKAVTGRLERIVVEAAHQGAGRGAEERSPPKKGPRASRGHPGGSAGARATAAGLTVPEIAGGDCESDEEMRRSELDESEHDDGGISDDEDERDRGTDDDMDDERAPSDHRGGVRTATEADGGREGRTERTNDDVFKTVAAMMNGQQAAKYGLDLDSAAALNDYGELKGGQQPTMGMSDGGARSAAGDRCAEPTC